MTDEVHREIGTDTEAAEAAKRQKELADAIVAETPGVDSVEEYAATPVGTDDPEDATEDEPDQP